MSPIVKKKRESVTFSGKYLLLILTILCMFLMIITFSTDWLDRPVNAIMGYTVVPFQKGIGKVGGWFYTRGEEMTTVRELLEENKKLKEELAALTEQNSVLQQEKYELNDLREMVELSEQYGEYRKTGAHIIGKDSGNWYSKFIIDKGANDGIEVDMNVIAGGGLVGRITEVGPNWARVTSIICDNQNVSGMTLSTGDNLIVSGSLKLMQENLITFSQLMDSKDKVAAGDKIVTSNISDKYLPGILIGYIESVESDVNNLTKSGRVIPVVDFEHLKDVLVILDKRTEYEGLIY